MALKSTIYKAELQLADMNRSYYTSHSLTIARHPSENDRRMMLRLLAFCIDASDELGFCKGVSTQDEPDLWQRRLDGEIQHWIELGTPDERRIRKACSQARRVTLYVYNQRSVGPWWQQLQQPLQRFDNLAVVSVDDQAMAQLDALAQRNMQLQCTIQDEDIWLSQGEQSAHIHLEHLKRVDSD